MGRNKSSSVFGIRSAVAPVAMRLPSGFLRARSVHAAIVALAAAGLRSRAQILFDIPQAECSASDLVGYDFKAEPPDSAGLSLHWSVSPFSTVSFQVVSTDFEVGWLSIGFSTDGNMIGSDAVVGAEEVVLEYSLGSKSLPVQLSPTTEESISLFPEQEITSTELERVESSISMSFTRPMMPLGVGKQPLFPESGEPLVLLWATGPDDAFGYHFLGRGAFTVDLLCVASPTQPMAEEGVGPIEASSPPPLTQAPSISPPEVLEFTVSPTSAPTSALPPQASDGSATSGALPGLFQVGGGLLGLQSLYAWAMVLGLFVCGGTATSALL